jgi:hypothetical protein
MLPIEANSNGLDGRNPRLIVPAQPVDATPSTALVRHCVRGGNHPLGCIRLRLSQGSVPAGLTLASDFSSCFQSKVGSSLVLRRPIETTRVIGS